MNRIKFILLSFFFYLSLNSFGQDSIEVFKVERRMNKVCLNGMRADTLFDFKVVYKVFSIDTTAKIKSYSKTIKYRRATYDFKTIKEEHGAYFFKKYGIWVRGDTSYSVAIHKAFIIEVDYTKRLLILEDGKDTLILGKTRYDDLKHLNLKTGYGFDYSVTRYFYKKHKKKYYYNYNDDVLLVFLKRKKQLVLTGFRCY